MKRKLSNASTGAYPKKRRTDKKAKSYQRRTSFHAGIPAELKYNDVTVNTDASTTSTEIALTSFAAGDTALLRDGNKALIKSVDFKINCVNKSLTQNNTVRFVLVLDKLAQAEQCIWGTGAAVQDVFDAATTVARRNVLSAARFIVLMDEVVVINNGNGTGGALGQCYIKRFVKIPKQYQLASWSGASATIPVANALTLMYLGSTAAGANAVTVAGSVRLRFEG